MSERMNSNKATVTSNVIADNIKNCDYSKSNVLIKAISSRSMLFSAIRTNVLAQVANDETLAKFDNKDVAKVDARNIVLLRSSKKDSELYRTLRSLSAFSYKTVTVTTKASNAMSTTVTTEKKIVRAFSLKTVLNSCDLYRSLTSDEINNVDAIALYFAEHEKVAIQRANDAVTNAQKVVHGLSATIEDLTDATLIDTYNDELTKAETVLSNRVKLFEYVSSKSNRAQIK